MAVVTGAVAAVGSAAYGIASAEKAKKKAKGQEKDAKAAAQQAIANQRAASAALAAMEAESMVPGFGDSNYIPGYKGSSSSFSNQGSSIFSLGNPTIYSPDGIAMGSMFPTSSSNLDRRDRALGRPIPQQLGSGRDRPVFEPFGDDDVGDRASRTVIDNQGNPMERRDGVEDEIRKLIRYDNGRVSGVSVTSRNRQRALGEELLRRRFNEVTRGLPKTAEGKPIFPDPETSEGQRFYASLPKSISNMANDPRMAQMYKGSNIVNPYANISDLSGIAEDVSDLVRDRSDLIADRTDLLADRTSLFESAADLGEDLSVGLEDLADRVTDLRPGAQDFSGLASDTSILASNPFANLQVATQAADLKAQQSDQALANTLSTIRATGAGAGGATAIAQAALQSKLGIAATIEQQEARNVELRAQGQQQIEQIRMSESKRIQDISLSERLRLEGLRQSEGLRIDDTRLAEGRRLQGIGVDEGRRLQQLSIAERMREQGLTFEEALRLQTADFETARERDRIRFDEAGRIQSAQVSEALRLQQIRLAEQQRLQNADALAREYQFSTAERREQNRLNRQAGLETQAMQTSADLQANAMAAEANAAAAKAASTAAIVQGGLGLAATAANIVGSVPTKSQKAFQSSFDSTASIGASQQRTGTLTVPPTPRQGFGRADSFNPNIYGQQSIPQNPINYGGGNMPLLTAQGG
tara:strand:- start:4653 stop:6749 length:2097 start_codon:yes stop_codon:yes gene_type:complete